MRKYRHSDQLSMFEDIEIERNTIINTTIKKDNSSIKQKSIKKSDRPIFTILPFSEPKKDSCGEFLSFNYGHTSRIPDLENEEGELEYSIHVIGPSPDGYSGRVNCNSITCEYCNYKHDIDGNLILDEEGNPEPNGAFLRTIEAHVEKLQSFQNNIHRIVNSAPYPENLARLTKQFYGKHRANYRKNSSAFNKNDAKKRLKMEFTLSYKLHSTHDVFYTLVDKKMGLAQRRNLKNTLIYISRRNITLNVYHSVLSPPPTWSGWDTEKGMAKNTQRAIDILREIGCFGGYIYFHPMRIPDKFNDRTECAEGPHWHFVGFSHIMKDVQKEVYEREGVVFKSLHHRKGYVEPVKSMRKTIAYVLSHVGVQIYREPLAYDIHLLERYHYVMSSEDVGNADHSDDSFILPDGETNFSSFKFPTKPLIIDPQTFESSVNLQKFLKTEAGRQFQLMRRHIKTILDQKDRIEYTITIKSNVGKKFRKILMRNFGVLSNSKNFIWGYKREKPQYWCPSCETHIPVSQMFPCHVLTESLIGVKGPPGNMQNYDGERDETFEKLLLTIEYGESIEAHEKRMKDLKQKIKEENRKKNLTPIDHERNHSIYTTFAHDDPLVYFRNTYKDLLHRIEPQEIDKYYKPFMKINPKTGKLEATEIYQIPLEMIDRLDINIEEAHRIFYKIRK